MSHPPIRAPAIRFSLTSSSCDPDGRLWSQDWDLDGDGFYGDATGATASISFAAPGPMWSGCR